MVTRTLVTGLLMVSGSALADPPATGEFLGVTIPQDGPDPHAYDRWSFVPLVSGAVAVVDDHGHGLIGAELRLRYGEREGQNRFTGSLAIQSLRGSAEPYALFGYDIGDDGRDDNARVVHVAVGAGYRLHDHAFVTTQLSVGRLFYHPHGRLHPYPCFKRQDCEYIEQAPAAQIDLVFQTQVATDGEVRVSAGIELDPIRIWRELLPTR